MPRKPSQVAWDTTVVGKSKLKDTANTALTSVSTAKRLRRLLKDWFGKFETWPSGDLKKDRKDVK